MMENLIMITPVNNGFILTLPQEFRSMNNPEEFTAALIKAGQQMHSDPLLKASKEAETEQLKKAENVFIFDSMEKVLAFLAAKYC